MKALILIGIGFGIGIYIGGGNAARELRSYSREAVAMVNKAIE